MKKNTKVYDQLCATCYQKLNALYRLRETPPERARGGHGKCALCDFRGELTAIEYDPATDKRSPEERAMLRAQLNAAPKSRAEIRHSEPEAAPAPKDYGFTRQTYLDLAALGDL